MQWLARLHHKLGVGDVLPSPHAIIDISGPLHRFHRQYGSVSEKKILNIENR